MYIPGGSNYSILIWDMLAREEMDLTSLFGGYAYCAMGNWCKIFFFKLWPLGENEVLPSV